MWSTLYNGRCLKRIDNVPGNFWSGVPKEECEKFPNHYSLVDGGFCLYCEGVFDKTTGVCSTTDCNYKPTNDYLLGFDENFCTVQCGGTFSMYYFDDGKVGRCHFD